MTDVPPPEPTDDELLAAHVAGDPDAFAALFTRHRNRMWSVALRTLGHPADAADALQDALVSAFRRAGNFRGDAAVTTWLHRIVVNACLDRARYLKSRRTEALPEADRELDLAVEPVDPVVERDRRIVVREALAQLPVDQRSAIILVDMEGYSVAEAAEMLGCAPGTVKSRCSRGRKRLAELLSSLRETEA